MRRGPGLKFGVEKGVHAVAEPRTCGAPRAKRGSPRTSRLLREHLEKLSWVVKERVNAQRNSGAHEGACFSTEASTPASGTDSLKPLVTPPCALLLQN